MITVLTDKKEPTKKSKIGIKHLIRFILIDLVYFGLTLPGFIIKYFSVLVVLIVYKKNLVVKTMLITSIISNKNLNKVFIILSFFIYLTIIHYGTK